jgi:hypothetical protein
MGRNRFNVLGRVLVFVEITYHVSYSVATRGVPANHFLSELSILLRTFLFIREKETRVRKEDCDRRHARVSAGPPQSLPECSHGHQLAELSLNNDLYIRHMESHAGGVHTNQDSRGPVTVGVHESVPCRGFKVR